MLTAELHRQSLAPRHYLSNYVAISHSLCLCSHILYMFTFQPIRALPKKPGRVRSSKCPLRLGVVVDKRMRR